MNSTGNMKRSSRVTLLAYLAASSLAAVSFVSASADATQSTGVLHVSANGNVVLDQDLTGSVVFDGNNATLNCNNHVIYFDSGQAVACDSGKCGVLAVDRTNIRVENCELRGQFNTAVHFKGVQEGTVQAATITGAKIGITFTGGSSLYIVQPHILGTSEGDAVRFERTNNARLQDGTIDAPTGGGLDDGDDTGAKATTGSTVERMVVSNAGDNGIESDHGVRFVVKDTTVTGGSDDGINLQNLTNALISQCTVSNNADDGIQFHNVQDSTVEHTSSNGNGKNMNTDDSCSGNTYLDNDFPNPKH